MSPGFTTPSSPSNVCSLISPAGIIIPRTRGGSSCEASPPSEPAAGPLCGAEVLTPCPPPRGRARQLEERLVGIGRGVDEGLEADVVAGPRLGEENVRRRLRLELRILARVEHLLRPVLRLLDVRLVERVDLEQVARDGGRELPPEELAADVIGVVDQRD